MMELLQQWFERKVRFAEGCSLSKETLINSFREYCNEDYVCSVDFFSDLGRFLQKFPAVRRKIVKKNGKKNVLFCGLSLIPPQISVIMTVGKVKEFSAIDFDVTESTGSDCFIVSSPVGKVDNTIVVDNSHLNDASSSVDKVNNIVVDNSHLDDVSSPASTVFVADMDDNAGNDFEDNAGNDFEDNAGNDFEDNAENDELLKCIPAVDQCNAGAVLTKPIVAGENNQEDNAEILLESRLIKVHPFFGKPSGELCEDERIEVVRTSLKAMPYRIESREIKKFNYEVFATHYQRVLAMTPKNMPCKHETFRDFLDKNLPKPEGTLSQIRKKIWQQSAGFSNSHDNIYKAFLCGTFPPIVVGNLAGSYIDFTYEGDCFPQFTLGGSGKMDVKCELCYSHHIWEDETVGRSTTRSTELIQGCRQVYEHSITKSHALAVNWWESNDARNVKPGKKNSSNISKYVTLTQGKYSNCLYLWNPSIVSSFSDDQHIRRVGASTIFKERKLWRQCKNEEGHRNCHVYNKWITLHVPEHQQICKESKSSSRSVYIPGRSTVIMGGKSVEIGAGIKSLIPPCLGKASSVGSHPYTCNNCWEQKNSLIDVMNKRKKSKLMTSSSRIGVPGFRTSYATKKETEIDFTNLNKVNTVLQKENQSLRKMYFDKRSWEEMLSEACESHNEEKLVIDLLSLMNQSKTLQFQVLENLIGKMKSGPNHRYSKIIKDISSLHMNRLGQQNYSLLQDLVGLCGKTTARTHAHVDKLSIGINQQVIPKAMQIYSNDPVIECSDEARTLRFIAPLLVDGKVELVGKCWDKDIDNWSLCRQEVPRKYGELQDDFSALKVYVNNTIDSNTLAKSTAIHNFAALAGEHNNPLIYAVWPTPNKGYNSASMLKIWDKIRYNCFMDESGCLREKPVMLMGHSTDSAAFQLAAANTLMMPTSLMFEEGVIYITLGIGESVYAAPYLSPLPSIAYLDYDHEMRLLLKCLKYPTLELTMWQGDSPVLISIEHLKELQQICLTDGHDMPFSETDLLFARYLEQNCDAAIRVFDNSVADLLDQHVIGSEGTSLYIRAVALLMSPFMKPCSSPTKMQSDVSTGITVLRLWKKILLLKKWRINAIKGAAKFHEKRGKYLTHGCAKTAEILFSAATSHMLSMFAHFKALGPQSSSPFKSGTKTTERIISELQGKTTQIQCLDAQPTLFDILSRVSSVQFNQLSEDRLIKLGAHKQTSTNRRRLSHSTKYVQQEEYVYPDSYAEFLEQQRCAYCEGVGKGKELFEKYCGKGADFLKSKKEWNFLEQNECTIPLANQFTGSLPGDYPIRMLKNVNSSSLLDTACNKEEEEIAILSTEDYLDDIEEDVFTPRYSTSQEKVGKHDSCGSSDEDEMSGHRKWYLTRRCGSKVTEIHIKRALKLLIPREYVSRERSRRHIAANYLPGLAPIEASHDIKKFGFVLLKLCSNIHVGKVTFLENDGKMVPTASSSDGGTCTKFKAILLDRVRENIFAFCEPIKITRWLNLDRIYSVVHLRKVGEYYQLNEKSGDVFKAVIEEEFQKQDRALTKEIVNNDIPLDYQEVQDIIDRKIDVKTHSYLYLVKFDVGSEGVWLPSESFYQPVSYRRRGERTRAKTQFAIPPQSFEHETGKKRKTDAPGDSGVSNKMAKHNGKKLMKNDPEVVVVPGKEISRPARKATTASKSVKISSKTKNKLRNFIQSDCGDIVIDDFTLEQHRISNIENGIWIADDEIHAASLLLTKQYPSLSIPVDTLRHTGLGVAGENAIQIMHDRVNHWIVTTNLSGNVEVFDSIYRKPHNEDVKKMLCLFYKRNIAYGKLKISYPNVQRQLGSNDCGLFAIAFAVDLAERNDLTQIFYKQDEMRDHLVDCFRNKKLTLFPRNIKHGLYRNDDTKETTLLISCHCGRHNTLDDMVTCCMCRKKYHTGCVSNIMETGWECKECAPPGIM